MEVDAMNAWTLMGFLAGLTLGGLGTLVGLAMCQAAAQADEEMHRAFREEQRRN
jgi:hypothetical protein